MINNIFIWAWPGVIKPHFTFIYGLYFYIQTEIYDTQLLFFSMYTIDIYVTLCTHKTIPIKDRDQMQCL